MIGLYPLRNATDKPDTAESVASLFSSISATVATTIPNFLLPTPTFTTPPYTFNTSVSAPIGGTVFSGLATSTYRPILTESVFNTSALPTISPGPTLVTLIVTDSSGAVTTSVESMTAVPLGVPPGWNAASTLNKSLFLTAMPALAASWILLYMADVFACL